MTAYEIQNKLRPCPLCGNRAEYSVGAQSRDTSNWFYIKCKNSRCGCGISVNLSGYQPDFDKEHMAFVERWNTRSTDMAECEGYNAEQLRNVADMLKENEIEPTEFMEIWQHFKSVVGLVKAATDRKWTTAIGGLIDHGNV